MEQEISRWVSDEDQKRPGHESGKTSDSLCLINEVGNDRRFVEPFRYQGRGEVKIVLKVVNVLLIKE